MVALVSINAFETGGALHRFGLPDFAPFLYVTCCSNGFL